jgi:predicted RNA-binding protein YlqC (UPF0109 family)
MYMVIIIEMSILTDIATCIETITKLTVDHPEDVIVECVPIESGGSIWIEVATEDLGKIIGKQGRTARSLRVLVAAMGKTAKLTITLDIRES